MVVRDVHGLLAAGVIAGGRKYTWVCLIIILVAQVLAVTPFLPFRF